ESVSSLFWLHNATPKRLNLSFRPVAPTHQPPCLHVHARGHVQSVWCVVVCVCVCVCVRVCVCVVYNISDTDSGSSSYVSCLHFPTGTVDLANSRQLCSTVPIQGQVSTQMSKIPCYV